MSNVFDMLNKGGGVVVEGDVTYVTSPTPSNSDDSTKVATSEWVRDNALGVTYSKNFTLNSSSITLS